MNINHRRCQAWLIKYDDHDSPYVYAACWWPRGHPDRHWAIRDGVVHRWETRR